MPGTYNQIPWQYNQEAVQYEGGCAVTYNYGGWTYNQPNGLYTDCIGDGEGGGYQTLQIRANIQPTNPTLDIRARLAKRQGWPIPDVGDPGLVHFTDTRLTICGRIQIPAITSQSLDIKGRIKLGDVVEFQARGFIVKAGHLQMKAYIEPKWRQATIPMGFDVRTTSRRNWVGSFFIPGGYQKQTIGVRTYIVRTHTSRFTGHFIVIGGNNNGILNTFSYSSDSSRLQTLRIGAGIIKP